MICKSGVIRDDRDHNYKCVQGALKYQHLLCCVLNILFRLIKTSKDVKLLIFSFNIFSSVLPAGGLQLSQGSDGLQTIAMTNAATAGGAIVHYAQGSDPQFIVPGKEEEDCSF